MDKISLLGIKIAVQVDVCDGRASALGMSSIFKGGTLFSHVDTGQVDNSE